MPRARALRGEPARQLEAGLPSASLHDLMSCQRITGVAAERLDERLLGGEAAGERAQPGGSRSLSANRRSTQRRGAIDRALEAREVDDVDADAGDHAAPAPCITRP